MYCYLVADIMTYGAQKEAEFVENELKKADIPFYSARLNKNINDKATADNSNLAERIVATDTAQILQADLIILLNPGVSQGALVEIGQILEYNRAAREQGKPEKTVIALSSDIRRGNKEPEVGDRKSYSVNAYVYGAILELTGGQGIHDLKSLPTLLECYKKELHPVLF